MLEQHENPTTRLHQTQGRPEPPLDPGRITSLPGLFAVELVTQAGGRVVLPGPFEDVHWVLDLRIAAVKHDGDLPEVFRRSALSLAQAVLNLSDAVVRRAGITGVTRAEHRPDATVTVPSGGERRRLLEAVTFATAELEDGAGAAVDDLAAAGLTVGPGGRGRGGAGAAAGPRRRAG